MTRLQAVLLLLIAATLMSTSGLMIKLIDLPAMAIMGLRSSFSVVILLAWVRPRSLRFTKVEWLAGLAVMTMQLFFIIGNQNAPAANMIFLVYTSPVWIVPLAWLLLREKPESADWIASIFIFSGMFFFVRDGFEFTGLFGLAMGILVGFCRGSLSVLMRMLKDTNPARAVLLGHSMGVLCGLPFAVGQSVATNEWLMLIFLGLFQMGLSLILISIAIKYVHALESNLVLMLEPILNPIWAFLGLGEVPSTLALIGAGLVLVGVLYRSYMATRPNVPKKASA